MPVLLEVAGGTQDAADSVVKLEVVTYEDVGESPVAVVQEYQQVQCEEWEQCAGPGCNAMLRAGKWGVCNCCWKAGRRGRADDDVPGMVLCRGCGVHVKADGPGACKPCLRKECVVNGEVLSVNAVSYTHLTLPTILRV